jgi:hypothetical protein
MCYPLGPVRKERAKKEKKVMSLPIKKEKKVMSKKEKKVMSLPILQVETCSFVPSSSLKALIKGKKAQEAFDQALLDGDATYGCNNRTMVSPSYILDQMGIAIDIHGATEQSFEKFLTALTTMNAQYIDLEN